MLTHGGSVEEQIEICADAEAHESIYSKTSFVVVPARVMSLIWWFSPSL